MAFASKKHGGKRKKFIKKKKAPKSLTFSYKKVDELQKYVSEQGMIIPRIKTGLSQKQQRRLATAIKRARHLAMLPFTQTI